MTTQRKALGKALEKKVARLGDGKVQPLSGVLADYPNDVALEHALVECKVRSVHLDAKGKRILSIDLDWLAKVQANAKKEDFDFGMVAVRPKGSPKVYALLDLTDLLELLSLKRES